MRKINRADDQDQLTTAEVAHDAIYDLFILVATIYSLAVIVLLFIWQLTPATRLLLICIHAQICAIFLVDLFINLIRSPNWQVYFFDSGDGSICWAACPSWSSLSGREPCT